MEYKENGKNRTAGVELTYTEHDISYLKSLGEYRLKVMFAEGVEMIIDLRELIETEEFFRDLRGNQALFDSVYVQPGGIVWTDEMDLSTSYLWEHGTIVSTVFDKLLGMHEATEAWGFNESTLRKSIACGRLQEGVDYKKMGGMYVVTRASMERLYGPPIAEIHPDEFCYPDTVMRRYNRFMMSKKLRPK